MDPHAHKRTPIVVVRFKYRVLAIPASANGNDSIRGNSNNNEISCIEIELSARKSIRFSESHSLLLFEN